MDNNKNYASSSSVTRRSENSFEFKTKCMFCGTNAKLNNKASSRENIFRLTSYIHQTISTYNRSIEIKKEASDINKNNTIKVTSLIQFSPSRINNPVSSSCFKICFWNNFDRSFIAKNESPLDLVYWTNYLFAVAISSLGQMLVGLTQWQTCDGGDRRTGHLFKGGVYTIMSSSKIDSEFSFA